MSTPPVAATSSASPSSTGPVASPTASVSSAAAGRVVAADVALRTGLVALSAASQRMDETLSYGDQRKSMATALAQTRAALGDERSAASASSRSCTSVFLARNRAAAAAARVHGARAALLARTALTRARSRGVGTARGRVLGQLTALLKAVHADPHPPVVTPEPEVRRAVAAELAKRHSVAKEVAATEARAAHVASKADHIASTARALSFRVC